MPFSFTDVIFRMFSKPVYSLQPQFNSFFKLFLPHVGLERDIWNRNRLVVVSMLLKNSPVEVVGNVDVALRSGQQEHDEGVL